MEDGALGSQNRHQYTHTHTHNSLPLKQLTASCLHIKQFAVTSSAFRLFTCERLSLRPFNSTVLHSIRLHEVMCIVTVEINSSGLELFASNGLKP